MASKINILQLEMTKINTVKSLSLLQKVPDLLFCESQGPQCCSAIRQ